MTDSTPPSTPIERTDRRVAALEAAVVNLTDRFQELQDAMLAAANLASREVPTDVDL